MLVVGCGDLDNVLGESESEPNRVPLDVYMKYDIDENGYYKVGYSGFNYVQVFAQSEGLQRIFWSSSEVQEVWVRWLPGSDGGGVP